MSNVIHVVNPIERDDHQDRGYHCRRTPRFVLWFGACGATYLMVWGHLEDALEECGAWLAEHAPGHVVSEEDHTTLCREACEDAGLAWPMPDDWCDDEAYTAAIESAEADLTYTESGWITSYEWGIVCEDPTRSQLMALATDLDATFAYKVPK